MRLWTSYPGFEGQENLGQEQDKAFQTDGEVLQDKVCDAHHPDKVKEVKAAEVGFGKYEARRQKTTKHLSDLATGRCGVFTRDGRMKSNRDKCLTEWRK